MVFMWPAVDSNLLFYDDGSAVQVQLEIRSSSGSDSSSGSSAVQVQFKVIECLVKMIIIRHSLSTSRTPGTFDSQEHVYH